MLQSHTSTKHPPQPQPSTDQKILQVRILWQGTTIDVGHFSRPKRVTMGSHPLNDFQFPAPEEIELTNIPIIIPYLDGFGVFCPEGMTGEYIKQGGFIEDLFAHGQKQYVDGCKGVVYLIEDDEEILVRTDSIDIECKFVESSAQQSLPKTKRIDYMFWRILSFSAILHFAFILCFQFAPKELNASIIQKGKYTTLIIAPQPDKKPVKNETLDRPKEPTNTKPKQTTTNQRESTNDTETPTEKNIGKKGMMGLINSMSMTGGNTNLFSMKTSSNLLNALGASSQGAGPDQPSIWGRYKQDGPGGGGGVGGSYGLQGTWGCTGKHCKKGTYSRHNISHSKLRRRKKRIMLVADGGYVLKGSLDKGEIARVVRRGWIQIRYCYERQLRKDPKLAGKVTLRWIIGRDGSVQHVSILQTTLNNERVENCIARRVYRWRFPQPRGGGKVTIRYPLIFKNVSR